MKKNKKSNSSLFFVIVVFLLIFLVIIFYPRKEEIKTTLASVNEEVVVPDSWQNFTTIDKTTLNFHENVFASLPLEQQQSLHANFINKALRCLDYSLEPQVKNQLINNLLNGASRAGVLQGFLSLEGLDAVIIKNKDIMLTKEIHEYSKVLNEKFLLRDDFELPVDMSIYDLKISLMDEIMMVAEKQAAQDPVMFYLWSGHLLNLNATKENHYFSAGIKNDVLINKMLNIPVDHLKAEVALSFCIKINELTNLNSR